MFGTATGGWNTFAGSGTDEASTGCPGFRLATVVMSMESPRKNEDKFSYVIFYNRLGRPELNAGFAMCKRKTCRSLCEFLFERMVFLSIFTWFKM